LGIVDRLLGGPGKPATLDRTLTEMEVALMDQLVQLLLGEWCKQWNRFQELRAEIFGHENNPRFLQSSSGDTVMLLIVLDSRMGECTGQIQIAIPYHAFEAVLTKLTEAPPAASPVPTSKPVLKWNHSLDFVPIQLRAQCPSFKMAARELLNLKVGEVLPLLPRCAEQIELRVGKLTKFKGRLGTRDEKWAVQITEISKP
jgi:flagellar motor switch protein FliM